MIDPYNPCIIWHSKYAQIHGWMISDSIMQIDLQPPLKITRITQNGDSLKYYNVGNAYYVKLKINQLPNKINSVNDDK